MSSLFPSPQLQQQHQSPSTFTSTMTIITSSSSSASSSSPPPPPSATIRSSRKISASSATFAAFLSSLHRLRWLIAATTTNYVTYSTWTLLNKYQFSPNHKSSLDHYYHHHLHHHSEQQHQHQHQDDRDKSGLGTDCPVFSTGLQMLLAGAIACSVSVILNGKVLTGGGSSSSSTNSDDSAPPSSSASSISYLRNNVWPLLKYQILPLGIARAIDIGCGNAALALVSVALQQILKSLLPLFVCLLSFFVLGKNVSAPVWMSLAPIVFGSLLAAWPNSTMTSPSSSSTSLSSLPSFLMTVGIALALISTFGRSLKAVLNAKLLSGSQKALPLAPLEVLSLEAPTSGFILLVSSTVFGSLFLASSSSSSFSPTTDSPSSSQSAQHQHQQQPHQGGSTICGAESFSFVQINVFAGILMFFNQLSYITVIKLSSALSCQVLMNLKMLLLITVSIFLFATPLSVLNAFGMFVAFVGCVLYAVAASNDEKKLNKLKKEEDSHSYNVHENEERQFAVAPLVVTTISSSIPTVEGDHKEKQTSRDLAA